ncbi:hypothetical protein HaLaN_14736 [Haematococcus lacustris]|uniref:Uncharacterized protein n=1 Tax=Haematococcus lacustris TaxID=44745 RepID=A0A699Z622_HAELA|nr:hypothetical protein HaLaN_14736 [Haematococcus lacustris]
MAVAEDVQQIPGVSGPLRKRSRTDQLSVSTLVWYHRHFGANGEGCASDRRKLAAQQLSRCCHSVDLPRHVAERGADADG